MECAGPAATQQAQIPLRVRFQPAGLQKRITALATMMWHFIRISYSLQLTRVLSDFNDLLIQIPVCSF